MYYFCCKNPSELFKGYIVYRKYHNLLTTANFSISYPKMAAAGETDLTAWDSTTLKRINVQNVDYL